VALLVVGAIAELDDADDEIDELPADRAAVAPQSLDYQDCVGGSVVPAARRRVGRGVIDFLALGPRAG